MSDAIVCQGLSRHFGDVVAVDRLDLTIEVGEVFGFLGPNGAGKTTTVRLLNGVLTATAGRAWVLGHEVAADPNRVRRLTGVLTETPSLYEPLSARQNLRFFGDLYDVPAADLDGRIDALLTEFGLAERADDRVGEYSKGMRQRLAIARTLLHEPALLFFDEPTAGLDPAAARMVNTMIANLSRGGGRTIFLCTHNLAEAQRLCDRIGVIDRGTLKAVGTPRELARSIWQSLEVEIELRADPAPAVMAALRALPSVKRTSEEAGTLVVELDTEEAIPEVVAAVAAAGGRVYRVEPREYTLEDIYFQIQSETEGVPGGAA